MKTPDQKIIVYDSNCRVCTSLRSIVLKVTSIPASGIKAFADLTNEQAARVEEGQFRNGMALIDTGDKATIYGSDGIAYIFSAQYKFLDILLRVKILRLIFDFLYKTIAYNRYIMATPRSRFSCDCYPDNVFKYRLSYIVITFLISIILTAIFGISLRGFFPATDWKDAATQMLLMAGSGWVLQIFTAIFLLQKKALDYIGHLGSIMVAGLIVLIPSILLTAIVGPVHILVPAVSVSFSSLLMLYMHKQRVSHLQLSQKWTVSWFIFLQATAFFWVYFFYLK